jgi:SAM-dependent methyltransferase
MSVSLAICYQLSKWLVLRRDAVPERRQVGSGAQVFDREAYHEWREQGLRRQFMEYFSPEDLAGRDVVDFGCGEGELSFLVAKFGVKSITGIEISKDLYEAAIKRSRQNSLQVRPRFLLASNSNTLDLPTNSVDVLLCFDVLEHVMEYRTIIREWHRALRKGGKIFIWWVPWWHPYGPHIESLLPIPWCHVFFSEKTLLDTCARIYEMPEFKPRIWDLDHEGQKKPNKWLNMKVLPEVNKLTMSDFERLCREVGFQIKSRRIRGFGSRLARMSNIFLKVAYLREFFTSSVVYVLEKPW